MFRKVTLRTLAVLAVVFGTITVAEARPRAFERIHERRAERHDRRSGGGCQGYQAGGYGSGCQGYSAGNGCQGYSAAPIVSYAAPVVSSGSFPGQAAGGCQGQQATAMPPVAKASPPGCQCVNCQCPGCSCGTNCQPPVAMVPQTVVYQQPTLFRRICNGNSCRIVAVR